MVFNDEFLDVDKICRTCLTQEGDMCSIFYKNEALASRLFDMITACSSVQVRH